MKRHILTLSILLAVSQLFGQESRFWVNGSGNWSDQSHWSTVSGGTPGATVPDQNTNVVFDQNSFGGGNAAVTVNQPVYVNGLDAQDAAFTVSGKKDITVAGSVNVDANVDFDKLRGALVLAADGDQTLNIQVGLVSDIIIESGNWTLGANLTTEGNISLKSGSLTTAGFEVNCAEFIGNDASASLNIENSTIICDKWNFGLASNLTLSAAGSTIMVKGNFLTSFLTASNLKYNKVQSYSAEKIEYSVSAEVTNATCPLNANETNSAEKAKKKGMVKVTIAGGSGTFNLAVIKSGVLTNKLVANVLNQNNYTFENIEPGTYNVGYYTGDINDESSFYSVPVTVEAPDDFSASIEVVKDADCFGGPINELAVSITGGTGNITFEWQKAGDSGALSTESSVYDIDKGSRLQVTNIKDANGCTFTDSKLAFRYSTEGTHNLYTIGNAKVSGTTQVVIDKLTATSTCEGEATGRVEVSVSGGSGVYGLYEATNTTDPLAVYSSTTSNAIKNMVAGTYNVIVTDSKGCASEAVGVSVTEIPAPVANAGDDKSICKNTPYTIVGASAEEYSAISWSTSGTGTFDNNTKLNPTYTASVADEALGSVTLTMTVAGNGTCSPASDDMVLSFVNTPLPVITTVGADVCGLSATLEATASMGGVLVWELESGEGTATFSGSNVTVSKSGSYAFKVKEVEPTANCEGYSATTVTLNFFAKPTANITTADATVCGTEAQSLAATAANYTSLLWTSNGSGSFSSTNSLNTVYTPSVADAGNVVTITLTASNGVCVDATDTYQLTVNEIPAPVNNTVASDICGLSTTASAAASLGGTLTWKCDESGLTFDNPNATNPTVTVSLAGTYNIYVEENAGGCTGQSAKVALTFYEEPVVNITTGVSGTICGDGTQSLSATSNCTNIQWTTSGSGSFSNATALNTVYTPSAADAGHAITLTITAISNNPTVCTTPVSANFTLNVNAIPNPTLASSFAFCGLSGEVVATNIMPGSTVEWIAPAGVTVSNNVVSGTTATATVTSSSAGMKAIELVETNNGCSNSIPKFTNLTFNLEPTLVLAEDVATVCSVDGYELNATTTNCSGVIWAITSGGTGSFSPATGLTTTFTPDMGADDTKTYVITATATPSAAVCPAPSKSMTLTVNRTPDPVIIANDINCGLDIELTASNTRAGSTFDWNLVSSNNGGSVVSHSNKTGAVNTITVSDEDIYTFSVVETLNGCPSAPVNKQVTVYKAPTVYAGDDATICFNEASYTLSDAVVVNSAPTSEPINWLSSSGSGSFYIESIMTPRYVPSDADKTAGSVTLTITTTHQFCGTASDEMVLTISPMPTPTITPDDGTDICGKTTTLTGVASQGGSLTWSQVSGPGSATITPTSGTSTTVVAPVAGSYEIKLTETNAAGCIGETTVILIFTDEPNIELSSIEDEICAGDSYDLTATFENCTGISWSKDLASGFLSENTTVPGSSTSTYQSVASTTASQVTITASPIGGCNATGAKSMVLTINPMPEPILSADNTCGLTYDITATSTVAGSTFEWSCSDANISFSNATGASTTIIAAAEGTYTIRLTEIAGSCSEYAEADITFVEEPTANAGADDEICADQLTYKITDAQAEHYAGLHWTTTGNGTFNDATIINPVYTIGSNDIATGSVTLTLVASANTPCPNSAVATKTITINPLPVPTITGDDVICLNSSATYTTEEGMTNYVWNIVGGTGTSTTNSIEVVWTTVGAGSVSVSYTNGNGCSTATPTVYAVTVNELPTIGLASTLDACTNSSIMVDAAPAGGVAPYTHEWTGDVAYLDALDVANPNFTCTTAGTYNLTYRIVDNNGCENTSSVEITNIQGPSVFAGEDATLCFGSDYVISDATASDVYGQSWITLGDGSFDDENSLNPKYMPSPDDFANGSVDLVLTGYSSSCGSVNDTITLTLLPEMVVAVGSENPFDIAATTKIEVEIQGWHEAGYDLGFYLVAPDGTEVKLYNHIDDIGGDDRFSANGGDFSSLKFSTYATDALDFTKMDAPISGNYVITDPNGWTNLYGKNPAEGGWSVKIIDTWNGAVGRLSRAIISFTDINRQGNMQTITYDSKTIDDEIRDNSSTTFYVPMGLRTSCYGVCDARAIVNVIGGSGVFDSFVWSDPSIMGTDTVDLCAGDFTVTVTDSYGCTASGSITVLSPDPIVLNTTGTDVMCYGGNDGSASVDATQGVGAYTYEWNDASASTTKDVDNLVAGTYIVKVTDENSCWSMDTVEISQPASALNIDNIDVTASSCIDATGSITFALSGGVEPYTVTCPTASFVDGTATALASDDYMIHIEDAHGCSIDTVVSTKPAEIILTITKEDVLCNGGDNGSLSVAAEGGHGGFTYSWMSGSDEISTEPSAENLIAGTYSLHVVDEEGCQVDTILIIDEPQKLVVTDNVAKASCGGSDGSIELTVSGGVEPYSYLWSNGAETATVSGLTEGVYSVIVTDANMCEAYDTIAVNNDSELAINIDAVTNVTNGCDFDGAIDITVSGAHGTPSFSWTNEAGEEVSTAEDPTQLPKGTYYVKVVDEHTCAINETAIVGGVDKFEVKRMIAVDAKCPGSADGTLEPDLTDCGGVGPYTYLWAHDGSTTAKATGLVAGTYSVTVYDANGCESTISGTVGEPAPITADFIMTPSGCSVNTGVFEAVNITGGNAPYDIMWFESVSSTLVFSGNPYNTAGVGNYKAVIVDAYGCLSDTTNVTMVDESNLDVTATISNIECYNDNSGSIALTVTGGSGNYAYAWSNGATESTATNLSAGEYYITVTDLTSNCQTAQTFTVEQPDAIVPSIVFTKPIQCAGDTEASFYATATGGAGNLVYTWYSNGTKVSSDSIVSNVGEGIYSLMVVDANGCSVFDTVTIVNPDTLKVIASNMGESDCSGATGWAEVTVEGGIAPYSYYWHSAFSSDTVGTDARAINLGVDIYVVEVTDAYGCNIVDTVEVLDKGTLDFPVNNIIGVTCATICDGSATIGLVYDDNDVYNDDSKLKFMWNNNPNDTLRSSNSLCLGTNRVLVVNPDGCRKLKTFTVSDELALRVVNIANYPDLNGDPNCNGALTVTVAGGVGNYSYTWTDADGNKIESDSSAYETSVYSLCEGLYSLHIEDENLNGCSVDTTIKIEHRPLEYSVIRNEATTCYGGDNGVLEVVGIGGYYEGYNYEWRSAQWPADSVATTALITNLKSGWYTFTISQRQKMVAVTDSVFVSQPTDRLNAQFVMEGSHCYDAIGAIKVLKTEGGNAPFTYSFSNELWATDSVKVTDNKTDITRLAVGDYTMHIVDNKGCRFDTIVGIEDLSRFTVKLQYTEPRCYGEANGSVTAVASSENGKNFKYEWIGKPEEKEATISGLPVGTYQLKVTDDSACVKFETIELSQPTPVTFSVSNTVANGCYNSTDGEISLSVKGGAGHFNQYSFIDALDASKFYVDKTETDSTLTLKGILPTGDYKALAYDKMGCASDTVNLRMYSRTPVIVMSGIKDLELPDCKELKADGTLAVNGRISVNASVMTTSQVSSTITGLGQISSTTVDLPSLFFKLDDGKAQNGKIFENLSSGTYTITVGYGEELACPETFTHELGSKNDFAITSSYFYVDNKNKKSVYTCPDNELTAFVTASAPFEYKFYANYVEDEDLLDPEQRTLADTTRTDSAVAYVTRFRTVRYFADSLPVDSLVVDTVPVVEPVEVPRYRLDTVGNVVYAVFAEGSGNKGEKSWVDDILPYGVETYYYFKATDGMCMDIDSIKATSMKPTYRLSARAYMDDATSDDLLVNGVYEVAEGARIVLDANDLKFDFNDNIFSEQNWLWASAPTDGNVGSGIKPETNLEDNPIAVQSYGNTVIKVRDSVNFEIRTTNESLTCYYFDSIKVNSISGIKPPQVFTPNGDGAHDTWHIEGLASYDKVTIYIFNRWGGRVWQYSGGGREYTANEWDGTNEKNKPVPSGTYYYVIQCSDDVLGGKKITGPVTIIR